MAIDTRQKRASSLQAYAPYVATPPLPDGALSQADRQHVAHSYAGILAATSVLPTIDYIRTFLAEQRPLTVAAVRRGQRVS